MLPVMCSVKEDITGSLFYYTQIFISLIPRAYGGVWLPDASDGS